MHYKLQLFFKMFQFKLFSRKVKANAIVIVYDSPGIINNQHFEPIGSNI